MGVCSQEGGRAGGGGRVAAFRRLISYACTPMSCSLLLLDEPTNHLDLEACVWLEEHLATYKKCLFVVSHSQDFLNSVCTHTVWLHKNHLKYYGGNYATFCKVVEEEERVQVRAAACAFLPILAACLDAHRFAIAGDDRGWSQARVLLQPKSWHSSRAVTSSLGTQRVPYSAVRAVAAQVDAAEARSAR